MKLLTKELEANLPPLYSQDGKGMDAEVQAKFFHPCAHATWFVTEYDPEQRLFFGWAELAPGCGELGYISLDELESVKGPLGLGIERDVHFTPGPLHAVIEEWKAQRGLS